MTGEITIGKDFLISRDDNESVAILSRLVWGRLISDARSSSLDERLAKANSLEELEVLSIQSEY